MKNNGLKLKIIALSVLCIILPVLLVGVLSYNTTYDVLLDTTIENARQLSDQLAQNIELSFTEIERFISISKNTSTIRFLLSQSIDERTQYSFQMINIFDLYRDTYRFSSSIHDIKIIGNNKNRCFSERQGVFTIEDQEYDRYMQLFAQLNSDIPKCVIHLPENGKMSILVGMPIYQIATNDVLGAIVLELDAKPFTSFTQNARIGKNGYFLIGDHDRVFFDEHGIWEEHDLSETEIEQIDVNDSGYFMRDTDAGRELVLYNTIAAYNWKVMGRVYMDDIMSEAAVIRSSSISIAAACLIIAAILNTLVIRWLFVPLDKLKTKMHIAAQGNLNVALSHRTNDEIAQLNLMFNTMMMQIRDLMQKNKEEQEELKKTELRVLQAQINPHFLYNTLDTIIWLIYGKENERAIEMVDALSQFFRTSLSDGKDFIPVFTELTHVTSYLMIQKNRNGNSYEYDIEVCEEMMDKIIMKLMIQPLAENAFYHGLKPKGGGRIAIRGRMEGEDIIFEVEDNGVGMEEDKFRKLSDCLRNGDTAALREIGYGLYNVQQRVRLYYGEGYGLDIQSKLGEGTKITLKIRGEKR